MSYYVFVDFSNCSGFLKFCYGFRNFAYLWSDCEPNNVLGICSWNPKSKEDEKSSNVAESATYLILPFAESTYNSQNSQFDLLMVFQMSGNLLFDYIMKCRVFENKKIAVLIFFQILLIIVVQKTIIKELNHLK